MAGLELAEVILAIIVGTLAAIVYSLRILILLERRVANMEQNIQHITAKVLKEEIVIEKALTKRRQKK
ncbi:hypothetical protein J4228_01105 [Candidatus Woesearchaeota archaeon]|nr:hypothetical protein [Candidatus Woesearchaeota archaeon]